MPRWIEIDRPEVFQAAATWRDRCLLERRSLFVDTENIWVPARLDRLAQLFDAEPDDQRFIDRLVQQLDTEDVATKQLAAELFWILRLAPSGITANNKRDYFGRLWYLTGLPLIPDGNQFLSDAVLQGLGGAGQGFLTYAPEEMQYAARAIAAILRADNVRQIVADPAAIARLITNVDGGAARQFRHMLLCILFPAQFDRVFSRGDRQTIARAFANLGWIAVVDVNDPIELDRALREVISEAVSRRVETMDHLDFYEAPLRAYWNPAPMSEPPAGTSKSHQTLNQILYGPPGTGKTYEAPRRAMQICGLEYSQKGFQKLLEDGQIAFVSFHQSYSYEDFVEGFRPAEAGDSAGGIGYSIQPGIFKRIVQRATDNWQQAKNPESVKNLLGRDFDRVFSTLLDLIEQGTPVTINTKTGIEYPVRRGSTDTHLRLRRKEMPETSDFYVQRQWLKKLWPHRDSITTVTDVTRFEPGCPDPSYHYAMLRRLAQIDCPADQTTLPTVELLNCVIIIDEINRANISKVFGELITLIEDDKRLNEENELTVTLPYSGEKFGVPPNLFILGTMNTADRSIALLDIALRRRFKFEELLPKRDLLPENIHGINIQELFGVINQRIEFLIDRDHCIGHAYFMKVDSLDILRDLFRNKIIPLLQEYCFDDWGRIVKILATGNNTDGPTSYFVTKLMPPRIPGVDQDELGLRYEVTDPDGWHPEHFQALYAAI